MILTLVARTLFAYLLVLLSLRIMGKREIGKLSVFDLVVSIMIAEISAVSLQDMRLPIWHGAFVIALLVLLQLTVSFVSLRSRRMHDLIEGQPTVLIAAGQINDGEMRRTRYNMNDLLMQLREKNISNIADVEFAILETSGKLSVFPKSSARPLTAADVGVAVEPTVLLTSLIVDGQIDHDKLAQLRKSQQWLRDQLTAQGVSDAAQVFYAGWDGQTLFIDRKDPQDRPNPANPQL